MAARVRQLFKAVAINSALLAGGLVFALLVGEIMVRLVAPQQLVVMRPDIWTGHDTLGWVVRGNVDAPINTGERTVRFVSDAQGFRSASTGARQRGDFNILLLGDSFIQAIQVDYEATLGARLEEKLSAALGRKVVVWNAGVNGWSPNQYLLRERELMDRAKYDVVLAAFYVDNDIVDRREWQIPQRLPAVVHRFRIPRNFSHREWVDAFFYPVNDVLEENSHLFQFLKKGFDSVLLRLGLAEPSFPRVIDRQFAANTGWKITADVAGDIAKTAASHGAPTVFGIIPAPYQVDTTTFEYYRRGFKLDLAQIDIEQPQRLLTAELTERGLNVVDVLRAFRAKRANSEKLYGSVDRHFTPAGHDLMADQVLPALEAALKAQKPEPKVAAGKRAR